MFTNLVSLKCAFKIHQKCTNTIKLARYYIPPIMKLPPPSSSSNLLYRRKTTNVDVENNYENIFTILIKKYVIWQQNYYIFKTWVSGGYIN